FVVCDILDFDAVREQMRGCDAVVHMAALRSPYHAPGQDVFRINTAGTFNVYEAAAREGIRRVVQASSINAIGCAWNLTDFTPRYLPVDEDHPRITNDPYSFSKQVVEDIGEYYWRREGISGVAFRFPGVYKPDYHKSSQYYERRDSMKKLLDDFISQPEAEQQRQLAELKKRTLAYRAERPLEYPKGWPPPANTADIQERLFRVYAFDRYNLWTFIDVRDAAQSVEKALTADYEGSHNLFVNDHHNSIDYDSRTLARLFFPEVTEWKQNVTGSESLVSIQRARELIGFEPVYSMQGE
ncbi:MAG TPA: NAD(P)-dependent oxidoreductase, partial [Aggregatilineales bacterium]|nr:NAD(P)-dependent oxidoreductase [Aggregatilineales bacterium]